MKRVIHLSYSLCLAGTEMVIMNWYRNINRDEIQFDFIVTSLERAFFKDEIEKLGGNVFFIHKKKNLSGKIKFLYDLYVFLKQHKNEHEIFHTHDHFLSGLSCMAAYFAGIKKRFTISHFADGIGELKNVSKFKKLISRLFINLFATKLFAVSKDAGTSLYGNKSDFIILNNGIDINKFKYNEQIRNKTRKELNLKNKFVLGHIGRLSKEKKHLFLVDIFNEIHKYNTNSILLLVGNGNMKIDIENKIKNLNLHNHVLFVGTQKNTNVFYQAMDCFVFPSISEGFGIVAIEAQSAGLPCFISDRIPNEVNIINTTKISLNKSSKEWAEIILEKTKNFQRQDCSNIIRKAGFDMQDTVKNIEMEYLK